MQVQKRDGRNVLFDREKIIKAVQAAFIEVDGEITEDAIKQSNIIADYINNIGDGNVISVEKIQDIVEKLLMHSSYTEIGRAHV